MPDDKLRRRAIIVGINEYKNKDEQNSSKFSLEGAENDARDFKRKLDDPENPEFDYNIDYIIGSNATCAKIRQALSDVFWKAEEPCDIALFYFSGHGIVDWCDEGYIAPYDMLFDDPFVYGIKMSELREVIGHSQHKCTIAILDCCYSGITIKDKGDFDLMAKVDKNINDFVSDGIIILTSSGEDQKSREITLQHEIAFESEEELKAHPHGVFTFFLLEGIDNGKTNLNELKTYVTERMNDLNERTNSLKKQQCNFLARGCGDLENIVIARSHEERNIKRIENFINNALRCYKSNEKRMLINAVGEIHHALEIHPKNQKALDVKEKITQALNYSKKCVDCWIEENTNNTNMYIQDIFTTLEYLSTKVSYDGILSLSENKRDKALLTNLCRVSAQELDCKVFEEKIKQYLSPNSTFPSQSDQLQVHDKLSREIQIPESSFTTPDDFDKKRFLEL